MCGFNQDFLFDLENVAIVTPISPVRDIVKRFFIGVPPCGLAIRTGTAGIAPFFALFLQHSS